MCRILIFYLIKKKNSYRLLCRALPVVCRQISSILLWFLQLCDKLDQKGLAKSANFQKFCVLNFEPIKKHFLVKLNVYESERKGSYFDKGFR